jgi:magnesium transporter
MPTTIARTDLDNIIEALKRVLDEQNFSRAVKVFESLEPADMAEVFDELDESQQVALLRTLPSGESADILEELNDEDVADLVALISDEELARIVDEMEPDKAADLLGDVHPRRVETLLADLNDEEELRPLLIHADDSAGGLMTTDFLALRRRMTAAEAIQAMRDWSPTENEFYYLFVVDAHGLLKGVLDLRRLIIADPQTQLQNIMTVDPHFIRAGADQEAAAELMARYDLLALPVVDEKDKLLGIITIDDVVDVLEEEATEDYIRLGGAEPLTRPYRSSSIFSMMRKRFGWLLLLFVTGTLTGSVMRIFQGSIDPAVMTSLAIFVPLLIGTGGNAGSQTTATIIRAVSTGDIDWHDALSVWWKEARVGLLLGAGMAIAGFLRSITWVDDPNMALTVSLAIVGIVFWATSTGAVLPLIAVRLGVDPTVVSGPVMSTLVDATGLFIYFSLARLILQI